MIRIIIIVIASIYFLKLFYIQVINDQYKSLARNNAIKERRIEPARGLIYDRNGVLLVYNEPIYDIMVIPKEVKSIDTLKLCELLSISTDDFRKNMKKAMSYSKAKESVFLSQISIEDFSRFQEYLSQFTGFFGRVHTMRHYPYSCAPNIFGYISEVDSEQIALSEGYYQSGDYAGKTGLEYAYDNFLRGVMGVRYVFEDNLAREQGSYSNGEFDQKPMAGKNLTCTIDIDLQLYAEKLMQNKRGSIVAIEPKTGEILCMVSSPSFDPNLLTGRKRGENYRKLLLDVQKPLINRPIAAMYPPGSTFKAFVALAAMDEGSITENFAWFCGGGYHIPGYFVRCSHGHPNATNVMDGLKHSCNPYFCQTFRNSIENSKFGTSEKGYKEWYNYMNSFQFNQRTGVDLPGEKKGLIPSPEYYNKVYGKNQWHATTIISLGIGQGEILLTPLQLANGYAGIANKGYFYTPHLVRSIEEDSSDFIQSLVKLHRIKVSYSFFGAVCDGLRRVVESGTARSSYIQGISLCGKTGTAQNPHGENHSIFAGYGPAENPRIAIAVVVENAGGGSKYAAPITSLLVEKYINDTIMNSRKALEERIVKANLINLQPIISNPDGQKARPVE